MKNLSNILQKLFSLKSLSFVLIYMVVFLVGNSAISKLFMQQDIVETFRATNLLQYIYPIAIFEVFSLICILIPRFTLFGVILLNLIMSGAVAIHLSYFDGSGILFPVLVGVSSWGWYFLQKHYLEEE